MRGRKKSSSGKTKKTFNSEKELIVIKSVLPCQHCCFKFQKFCFPSQVKGFSPLLICRGYICTGRRNLKVAVKCFYCFSFVDLGGKRADRAADNTSRVSKGYCSPLSNVNLPPQHQTAVNVEEGSERKTFLTLCINHQRNLRRVLASTPSAIFYFFLRLVLSIRKSIFLSTNINY